MYVGSTSSSSSSSSSTDYSRITGLATGMDTDAIVKQMMAADQTKIDKAKQTQQYTQWEQTSYQDIIKELRDFRDKYLTNTGSTSMYKSTSYNGTTAKITGSDDTSVGVKTLPGARKGSYAINVVQLATGDKISYTPSTTDLNKTLSQLGVSTGQNGFTVTTSGKTFNVSMNVTSSSTLSDLAGAISSAKADDGTVLSSLANVNYSQLDGSISLETIATGDNASMTVSDTYKDSSNSTATGNILSTIFSTGVTEGHDAIGAISEPGGIVGSFKQASNTFTMDNVTYNLQDVTVTTSGSGSSATVTSSPVTFSVTADSSDSAKLIKDFVTDYNKLVSDINTKLTEKKDSDYQPLTDSQKSQMTDDQITKWETKAKTGILRNDSDLSNLLSNLRTAVYSTVKGAGLSNIDIGITTTSDYKDGGQLQIDDDKLEAALENNADSVYKWFAQSGKDDSEGIVRRFYDAIDTVAGSNGTLVQKAGYTNSSWEVSNELSESISKQKTQISLLQENFTAKQTRLRTMWATIESNMNSLSSQSSWLSSALSS